ncbi:MAG TPA: cytochrome P460 family protein [Terriglobia bacterium]|nr:cytochrome P460 family protein [Terriglobia bacterium]
MKRGWPIATFAAVVALAIYASRPLLTRANADPPGPRYTQDGKLMFPSGYREWIYVSSGLGMNYGPTGGGEPAFTNVFVTPAAYQHYRASGHWSDKTMFVLEVYGAASHGSIIRQGNYQDNLLGVEAEVKDESRFPEKWAYFGFGTDRNAVSKFQQSECWSCHNQNGAVENTFVQFYPTLISVAYDKNTIKPAIHLAPTVARVERLALTQGWASVQPLLDQARTQDPNADILRESSLNSLGYRLLSAGKNSDAVAAFEQAVRDYPSSANAYDSLAQGYLAAGNKAKALECSEKALELLARSPDISPARRNQIAESAKARIARLKSE